MEQKIHTHYFLVLCDSPWSFGNLQPGYVSTLNPDEVTCPACLAEIENIKPIDSTALVRINGQKATVKTHDFYSIPKNNNSRVFYVTVETQSKEN